jgi:hypothetical protein
MIAQSVAEIVKRHVKLTVEGIDRMYLNVFGGPDRTRTCDLRFRKPLLYPAELRDRLRNFVSRHFLGTSSRYFLGTNFR